MAARKHSWEAADVHMQSSAAVAELDEHDEAWGADDVDDNDPNLAVDLATPAILDYLLDLADESKRDALGFALTHHRDTTSGIWVLYLTSQRSQFCKLQVVVTRKQDASRITFDMCLVPGRSVRNLKVMLGCRSGSSTCWTTNGLPKHYREHPVVKRNANEDVFPVALKHGCGALLVD